MYTELIINGIPAMFTMTPMTLFDSEGLQG